MAFPVSFRFSFFISASCILLACLMLWASSWQWQKYKLKRELLRSFELNSSSVAREFSKELVSGGLFWDRKVRLRGVFDYGHQMVILNRKHESGPGGLLITPFRIEGGEGAVLVSRGFIPFRDIHGGDLSKFSFTEGVVSIEAVLKRSVSRKTWLSPRNPESGLGREWVLRWQYPEVEKMVLQLPYKAFSGVYLQLIGGPQVMGGDVSDVFPAEYIRMLVPPSTHFGYTFEWIFLAIVTLVVGYVLQVYPGIFSRERLFYRR